jgi:Phosphatase-1 catalytic subunit binding region
MPRVTFDESRNEVHSMVVYSFAYKNARKRYWEYFAADARRFQKRIERISVVISPILSDEHRYKMYRERFEIKESF